jgi:hypothetical protein
MPDISRITLPSGTTYDIKDATARQQIAGGVSFLGVTTTPLTDGANTNPIVIGGNDITASNGSIVVYGDAEFVFSSTTGTWFKFGDTGDLGDLAYKDNATGNYVPEGTVSAPTVTVTPSTETVYVPSSATGGGSVTAGTAASCTLPTLEVSVSNETMSLSWTAGSFTANTPTDVTLPTFSSQTVVDGIDSATASQPTFTGTQKAVTVS